MDVIVERPAALDVHKEQVTACVRGQRPAHEEPPGRKTDVKDAEWLCQLRGTRRQAAPRARRSQG